MPTYDLISEGSSKSLNALKAPIVGKDVVVEIHVPTDADGDPDNGRQSTLIYKGQYTDVSRYHNSRIVEYVETGYSTPLNIATTYSFGGTLAKGDVDDVLSQLVFGTTRLSRSGGRRPEVLDEASGGAVGYSGSSTMLGSPTGTSGDSPKLANPVAYAAWQGGLNTNKMTVNPYILKIFKAYSGATHSEGADSGENLEFSKLEGRVHIYEEVVFSNFRAVSNAGSDIATHVTDWYAGGWEIQELI